MARPDWTDQLPRSIKLRLDGASQYAASVLEEANLLDNLTRTDLRKIQLAAFLISLDEFLRDGSEAASQAVDAFKAVGVDGFTLGSERFEGRNDAVTRGARLSGELRRTLADPRLLNLLASEQPLRQVIVSMGRRLSSQK